MYYYREELSCMPISPLNDVLKEDFMSMYVPPKLSISDRKLGSDTGEMQNDITNYFDLFNRKGEHQKNIYIQGEPGIGKSAFARKLTIDWSKSIHSKHLTVSTIPENVGTNIQFRDIETLQRFNFLFLIFLRNCEKQCDVEEMIQNVIVLELNKGKQYTEVFIQEVLSRENCLIVFDGLDEWIHPTESICKRQKEAIPHRRTGSHCTFLTLTRPWKLALSSMEKIDIDPLFTISGVLDGRKLLEKYANSLNKCAPIKRDIRNFERFVPWQIAHLLDTPLFAVLLLCLWYENNSLPQSVTNIYISLLDMQGKRNLKPEDITENECRESSELPKFLKNKLWCQRNFDLMKDLGHLAFFTLHTDDKQSKIVFPAETVRKHLRTSNMEERSVKAGILTKSQILSVTSTEYRYCFQHKSIQEFLAAFFFAIELNENENLVKIVKEFYSGSKESLLSIDRFYVFICGLNPTLASEIFEYISTRLQRICEQMIKEKLRNNCESNARGIGLEKMKNFTGSLLQSYEKDFISVLENLYGRYVCMIEDILLQGYNECLSNGSASRNNPLRPVTYFHYNTGKKHTNWKSSSDRIETLFWRFTKTINQTEINGVLKQSISFLKHVLLESPDKNDLCIKCLGASELPNLESLGINSLLCKTTRYPAALTSPCIQCHAAEIELKSKFITHLSLQNIKCNVKLYLRACTSLECLVINNSSIAVFIHTQKLEHCQLEKYDLSKGTVAMALHDSQNLKFLNIYGCEPLQKIARFLPQKKQLHTLQMGGENKDDCSLINVLPDSLQHVMIWDVNQVFWRETMSNLPLLQSITIRAANFGNCDILLPNSLQYVDLCHVTMTQSSGKKRVVNLPSQLQAIRIIASDLGDCDITLPGSLKKIDIQEVTMTPESWSKMLTNLPSQLHTITFSTAELGEMILPDFLRRLTICNINITQGFCGKAIKNMPSQLQCFTIIGVDLGECDMTLADSLQRLDLVNVTMTSSSWRQLVDRIRQYPHLKEFKCFLSDCWMSTTEDYLSTIHAIRLSKNIFVSAISYPWRNGQTICYIKGMYKVHVLFGKLVASYTFYNLKKKLFFTCFILIILLLY